MSEGYTNLSTLKNGTKFHVLNGNWDGYIFSKYGKKYMHIYETNKDVMLRGYEEYKIEILKKKVVVDSMNCWKYCELKGRLVKTKRHTDGSVQCYRCIYYGTDTCPIGKVIVEDDIETSYRCWN